MKKRVKRVKKRKTNIVFILVIVAALILVGLFYIYFSASQELVPVIKVSVEASGLIPDVKFEIVSYEQTEIPLTEEPKETRSHIPGIYFSVFGSRTESGYFQPFTKWASQSFKGAGKYDFTASFIFEPEKGEFLKLQFKIIDPAGDTLRSKEIGIIWGYEQTLEVNWAVDENNGTVEIKDPTTNKKWIDPAKITEQDSEYLPGVEMTITKNNDRINMLTSENYNGIGNYTLQSYFTETPKFGEIIHIRLNIKDKDGKILSQYPNSNETWNYIWW
jgi:hypothetical protein